MEDNDEVIISEVLQRIVAAAASSTNDWTHYEWQSDLKSNPSASTSFDDAERKLSLTFSSSISSSSSSDSDSDTDIESGSAAARPGRWKNVRGKTPSSSHATVAVVESKPANWAQSSNWTISLAEPLLVGESRSEYKESECYLKGAKWAPDGSCWLTAANDNSLRIYNLPEYYCRSEMAVSTSPEEYKPAVKVNEGESIYDYCWYPFMDSSQPHTCYFLSTSKDHPIHLRDAFTGNLAGSYIARNHVDVLIAPFAIHCCRLEGRRLYAGYNRQIRVFDLQRPGNNSIMTKGTVERTMGGQGQTGLISCFAQEPTGGSLLAVGCYDRSIGLYSTNEMMQFSVMTAHRAGVTHLAFGSSGYYLYSGARKDSDILCWDVRRPGLVVAAYRRAVATNQRIYFDITGNGRYLVSGGSDGQLLFFDLNSPIQSASKESNGIPVIEPVFSFTPHSDCTNGASFHPSLPLLLTSSGQRWFDMTRLISETSAKSLPASASDSASSSDEDDSEFVIPRSIGAKKDIRPENSVKLWQFDAIASQLT